MVTRIAHPTDFTSESLVAFLHALRLALSFRCRLDLIHVHSPEEREYWPGFPSVRETLSRWGLTELKPSAGQEASNLGITVEKIEISHQAPIGGIIEFLSLHRPELIVLAAHDHAALTRLLAGSVSERLARESHMPTLFLGPNSKPFVDEETGTLSLNRLAVPLARNPSPRRALRTMDVLLEPFQSQVHMFHVGDVAPWILSEAGDPIDVSLRQGPVIETILEEARSADLIAMPTDGRHGIFEMLIGSTTEQVLHRVTCPLLALPA